MQPDDLARDIVLNRFQRLSEFVVLRILLEIVNEHGQARMRISQLQYCRPGFLQTLHDVA